MTEKEKSKKCFGMVELELALSRIANHYDPMGDFTWKDLALEMAEVAREALVYSDAQRGSES